MYPEIETTPTHQQKCGKVHQWYSRHTCSWPHPIMMSHIFLTTLYVHLHIELVTVANKNKNYFDGSTAFRASSTPVAVGRSEGGESMHNLATSRSFRAVATLKDDLTRGSTTLRMSGLRFDKWVRMRGKNVPSLQAHGDPVRSSRKRMPREYMLWV